MSGSEKHSGPRVAVVLRLKLRYPDMDVFIARFAINISRVGLFIRTKKPKPPGTVIRFELCLADGSIVLHGIGEVLWTRPCGVSREPYGMGMAFVSLDAEGRAVVDKMIHFRENSGFPVPNAIPFQPTSQPTSQPTQPTSEQTEQLKEPAHHAKSHEPALEEEKPALEGGVTKAAIITPSESHSRRRPRSTVSEVIAQAMSQPVAIASDSVEDLLATGTGHAEISVQDAIERAKQLTALGSGDLLSDLESVSEPIVVKSTPREASERLAAILGDLPPVRRKRRAGQTVPVSGHKPTPINTVDSSIQANSQAILDLIVEPTEAQARKGSGGESDERAIEAPGVVAALAALESETSAGLDDDAHFFDDFPPAIAGPGSAGPGSAGPGPRQLDDQVLEKDINAAIDALIPAISDEPAITDHADTLVSHEPSQATENMTFEQLASAEPNELDELDKLNELFPPLEESTAHTQGDYIISFQPPNQPARGLEAAPNESVTPILTPLTNDTPSIQPRRTRATSPSEALEIDLSEHMRLEDAGEGDPTYISDMPSAALASDLVHDQVHIEPLGRNRSLEDLLDPEEPFLARASILSSNVSSSNVSTAPLSKEVPPNQQMGLLVPESSLAPMSKTSEPTAQSHFPPPIPTAAPAHRRPRPPSTIPPEAVLDSSDLEGLDEIEIDLDVGEFDESPGVVTQAPVPVEVNDPVHVEDDKTPLKRGLLKRLFKKT